MRINRYLAQKAGCSRREADRLIESGRVLIDGRTAQLGSDVLPGQKVTLDGKALGDAPPKVYLAFNKPRGIECTTDESVKDNIISYIDYSTRIFPIGRLDKDSEGLILLTNDGDAVNQVLRAEHGNQKEYRVWLRDPLTEEQLTALRTGVRILDANKNKEVTVTAHDIRPVYRKRGKAGATGAKGTGASGNKGAAAPSSSKGAHSASATKRATDFKETKEAVITLTQGLNRQVRRMFDAVGNKVTRLKRIRIMHIKLGRIPVGYYRELSEEEVRGIFSKKGNQGEAGFSDE